MEKFDPKEYRDNLAGLIKSTPDTQERREILRANSDTIIYERAQKIHLEDIQTLSQKEILPIKEIAERVKHSSHLQKQFFGRTFSKQEDLTRQDDELIENWSQQHLESWVTDSIGKMLMRSGKTLEAAGFYEREAPSDTNLSYGGNLWKVAGSIREKMGDFMKAIEDYKNYLQFRKNNEKEWFRDSSINNVIFDIARCMEKAGNKDEAKLLCENRARELENQDLPGQDFSETAQLYILGGREDEAKRMMGPLLKTHLSSAGKGRQWQYPMEEKIADKFRELRSKGYEQDPETKEWKLSEEESSNN